ncbi:MAG: hypothetical protein ACRCTJ_05085 [Brevinema sp.]
MIVSIKPVDMILYNKDDVNILAQKLAIKTCILRNQKSVDYIVLDHYYLPISNIYSKMIYTLNQGKNFYLIFPKVMIAGLIHIESFYDSVCMLLDEELKGNFIIYCVENQDVEKKYYSMSLDNL